MSIYHYRQLEPFLPEVSRAALNLWDRHLDYLTPQHIPWSLVNDDFSNQEREALAKALLDLLDQRVQQMPPARVSYPGPNFCRSDQFWPQGGGLPSLALLATPASFLPLNIAEVSDEDCREWWSTPVTEWSDDPNSPNYKSAYHAIKVMATRLDATNDTVEASLKGVKDTAGSYHGEEMFQHGLVTLFEERKRTPAEKSGKISKKNLKKLVRSVD